MLWVLSGLSLHTCGDWNENGPRRHIYLNVRFPVDGLFRKDYEVWPCWSKCGLPGEGMPLKVGFEVLIAHARPNLSLPPSSESDMSPHLSLQQHACLLAITLPTMMIMD